ncbi:MAG: lipoate--protein ligase family protein [Anaerolineae bacterium]|nr:lipoate--protein ligase family protein [Anaerolineae bacterium]MDW8070371.1 biotin/lipoate A/B protein ligase family protein [Anaerolineae bacterium]
MEHLLPPATWRLLITPPAEGAMNMAVDEAILHALADGKGRPTLRFYQWHPPCLSLGYNQPCSDVDTEACARLGYTWVRRPTGGRAILHCDELTYSVIAPEDEPRVRGGITESYRRLSQGLLAGLRILGADVFQPQEEKVLNAPQGAACFDTPSNYEITVGGKKLIGSAQVRRRGQVLQHGALPLYGDLDRIFACLRTQAGCRSLRERAITLEQALGRAVSFEEVVQALRQGFSQALNLELVEDTLNAYEQHLAEQLYHTRYTTPEWNCRV